MRLEPFERVDGCAFTASRADVVGARGSPAREGRNGVGLNGLDYGSVVYRFQDNGRLEEVTMQAPVLDLGAVAVPFASLAALIAGQEPPASAKHLVDLWRPLLEERGGRNLDRLERLVEDQRRFGDAVHDLLEDLDMGEDRAESEGDEEEDTEEQRSKKDEQGEDGERKESDEAERMRAEDAEASSEDQPDDATEGAEASTSDMMDDTEGEEGSASEQTGRDK